MTKKSRRYISVFLAAAMITTFTPAEVFSVTAEDISYPAALAADNEVSGEGHADQAATDEASVTIDGATLYYATLEEAFSAANGKTAAITMLNDAECIYTDSKNPCPLPISKGSVTLDMNGKTLSGKSYGTHGIVDVSGGSLSVQGEGKIIVTNTGLFCKGNGKLTVKDITLELVTGQFYAISGVQNNGGTVILNGVKMTGAASDGQIHQYSGNTTINDVTATGTVESQPNSVLYYNEGTLKINGGTFDKISVDSGNYGNIDAVSELLGDGCTYRHTDKTWATADELAAMEISNVTVEKIPLTIAPEAETSWYYNSDGHSLQMNAVPTTADNEITYEWYNGDTRLDCTSDAYTIPKTTSAGSYAYTCKATCDGYTLSNEFTFEIKQSGTSIDNIKTYNGGTETDTFTAADTITVKAEPTATGTAPKKAAARLRADPTAGQMALFIGDMQVSEPVNKDGNGVYTMTVGASDVLLQGNKEPNTAVTLTAKFVGNDNMADASGTVNVTVSAAAKAEKDGAVIGYYGASSIANAFVAENDGAKITLLNNAALTGTDVITIPSGSSFTFELDGHTCTAAPDRSAFIIEGSLTVSDSGESGGVTGTPSWYCFNVRNGGSLTVHSGSYSGGASAVTVDIGGTLNLTGGTFAGTGNAIKYTEGEVKNALTNNGTEAPLAFYQNDKPYEPEGSSLPAGTFTVQECKHEDVEPTSNNDGTHTLNCPCCGYNGTAEDCTYGDEYTTDETNHTKTCTECGYENIEAHTIKFTAESDINNIITLSEACDICGYKKELGTVAVTIPELTYGETDKSVTLTDIPVNCFVIFKVDDGSEFQNGDGDTEISRKLTELFGSNEMTAGEHKLKLTFVNADNKYSNECELTFTVKECPHESDVIETVSNNNGTHTLTCKRCGHTETVNCTYGDEYTTDEINHIKTCTVCGYSVTEAHTSTGSNAATCAKKAVCDICGLEYGELAAHNYSAEWQSDETNHWHECTVCHNDKKDTAAHTWGEGVETTSPTEDTEGVMTYTCTVCNATKTEPINKLPHTHQLAKTEEVPATCTAAGTSEYWTCSKCGDMFSDENGATQITEIPTITALGHSEEIIPEVPATCTAAGSTAGVKCSRCGTVLTAPETIPATGHNYGTDWKSEGTGHWHECTICGDKTGFAAHTSDRGTVTVRPTTETTGTKVYACTECKAMIREEMIPVLDPEHVHEYETEWKFNSDHHWHECICGETSEMSAHIWDNGVPVTAPTCTEAGVMTYTCTVCGITKTEPVNALGHSFTNYIFNNDATCTEDGTETAVCDRCSETSTRTAVGSKKGHTEDGGTVTKQPTETETGIRTFRCTVCGTETRTETIPPVVAEHTHAYGAAWNYDPSSHWHECECGEKADMSSHISNAGTVTKYPTETETGIITYNCMICGYEMRTETIPATGSSSSPSYPPQTPSNPIFNTSPNTTPSKGTGKEPYISGANDKKGWEAITNTVSNAPEGEKVTVRMNGNTRLPKDIISQIKGRNIDLVLEMGGGFSWTVNGTSVTNAKTVDMKVGKTSKIPRADIDKYFGGLNTVQLDLAHNGDFGFTGELTLDLGNEHNGMYANSYCYKSGGFEFGDSAEIANGKAKLRFVHASKWLIVIDGPHVFEDISSDAGLYGDGEPISTADQTTTATPAADIAVNEVKELCVYRKKRRYRVMKKTEA